MNEEQASHLTQISDHLRDLSTYVNTKSTSGSDSPPGGRFPFNKGLHRMQTSIRQRLIVLSDWAENLGYKLLKTQRELTEEDSSFLADNNACDKNYHYE